MAPELRLLLAASGALVTGVVAATLAVIARQEYQRWVYNNWRRADRFVHVTRATAPILGGHRKSREEGL
jgi:hypothetical protein